MESLAKLQRVFFKNPLESHFSFKKKCLVRRTVMNENALHSPDLGKFFTYSERMRTTHRKFLQASEVKVFAKNSHKMIEYSEAWQSFRDLTFKNPLESHFSFNKKCLVGCTVMIERALSSPDFGERFTYLECMRATHRKFSTGF